MSERYLNVWVHCEYCGKGQCLGVGLHMTAVTDETKASLLRRVGWYVTMPPIKGWCEYCKPKPPPPRKLRFQPPTKKK